MFLAGDIILCRSKAWVGRAIRWCTQRRGEAPTWANHVAGIVKGGPFGQAVIGEALWSVAIHPLQELAGQFEVWRHGSLSAWDRFQLGEYVKKREGETYGLLKLGRPPGEDALVNKLLPGSWPELFLFRRLCLVPSVPICSKLWADAYDQVLGYRFGVEPEWADPDHLHDHVKASEKWLLVLEHKEAANG